MDSQRGSQIVTRIAPSPTGHLHIGTVRTALVNFLFAHKNEGRFLLRIEDTDRARSKKEYEDEILEGLAWLGLTYDECTRQSDALALHTKFLGMLISDGKAFISREKSEGGSGEREVVRLKNVGSTVVFDDIVRGEIRVDTAELGDFVIARAVDDPLYHFAVVVDDNECGVTHVIRGEDHISNTPRQILIQEAFGFPRPAYAHLPLILAPDRSKLSKRHGAVALSEYKEMGILPEALLNYLALLGWNPGTDEEIFTLSELVSIFDFSGVQKGGAIFSKEKLLSVNREHIKKQTREEQSEMFQIALQSVSKDLQRVFKNSAVARADVIERISAYGDIATLVKEGEFDFYIQPPVLEHTKLTWKSVSLEETANYLMTLIKLLEDVSEDDFSAQEKIKKAIFSYADEKGRGGVLWPMRYALTGRERSPDPFTVASVLGKKETIARLQFAVEM
jgi:glutamyl-tRNA synthetase